VIICAYATLDEKELADFQPKLIYLDEHNLITRTGNAIPAQAA
jgi:aspartate 1-decarboxylase